MAYWSESQLASIHKMLNPESVAIVGATPRMQYGGRMLNAMLKAKDRLRIYPVNPRYDEIMETKTYPSVRDLPEAPDVVCIVVPYNRVLDVLKDSHEKGAKSAIVISAGFSERGEDDRSELQSELGRFCRGIGVAVQRAQLLGTGERAGRHLGQLVITGVGRVDRAGWVNLPKWSVGLWTVFDAGGGGRHWVEPHHLDGERGGLGLFRFCPLPAGR